MLSETRFANKNQEGFSLLELLVVVVIVGVLAALAIPNFVQADGHLQRQNFTRQLKNYFERARFDSIKRDAQTPSEMAKIIVHNQTSFSTVLDFNNNGAIETGEVRLTRFSGNGDVKIVGNNLAFPITITFDRRGRVRAVNGADSEITPTLTVCGKDCTYANADEKNSDTLSISPTGTVALVKKGEVFFDRLIPDLNVIGTGSKINCDGSLQQSGCLR